MDLKFVIGIGASKAGTTWLGDYFAKHPDICFSPRKELHYFDAKYLDLYRHFEGDLIQKTQMLVKKLDIDRSQPTLISRLTYLTSRIEMAQRPEAYIEYFKGLSTGQKYCSEITPNYSMLPDAGFNAIKQLTGKPKIIMLMRNPIDRHWSHLRFKSKKVSAFDHIQQYEASFKKPLFFDAGDYIHTHQMLGKHFDDKDILYLFYEELFRENDTTEFQKIIDFLEIKKIEPNLARKSNATQKEGLSQKKKIYGIRQLKSIYEYVFKHFDQVPQEWHADYKLIS